MSSALLQVYSSREEAQQKVSIIIPSYRGSDRLLKLVEKVASLPYPSKELIVVVDEPAPLVAEKLRKIPGVKVVIREKRAGKVSALNTALKMSTGDLVVFLDDDVAIEDELFLHKIVEKMRDYDIGDIKKVIVDSGLLSKMVYIEYVSYNFASMLMGKLAKRTIAVNGAAFAMKRKALEEIGYFQPSVSEDFDIALRSFKKEHRFTYIGETYVLNYPPENISKWFKQRKRWAIGLAIWLQENFLEALTATIKMPHVIIPALIYALPSLLTTLLAFSLYNHSIEKTAYLVALTLSTFINQFLPFASIIAVNIHLSYLLTVGAFFIPLVLFSLWHYIAARVVKSKTYLYLYPLYLYIYQLFWLSILLAGFLRVLILRDRKVEDWVV
jgi:cellulose synthase/poly-beta-1,6-N-acetylglucosamine synthase-like glycosyltransferase